MFRIFSGKKDDKPKPTRAKLGEASTMYFDKEKGRWRERGKEHLEKEDEVDAPPPMTKSKEPATPSEGSADAASPPPPLSGGEKKEANYLDALCAPPNPYAHRLGGRSAAPKLPQTSFGFGMPPVQAAAPVAAEAGEEGGGDGGGEAGGEAAVAGGGPPSNPFAPQAPAAAAANPFAPKGFAGAAAQSVNPNAPRGFGGAAAVTANPNAPRAFREGPGGAARKLPKPVQGRPSPFGAPGGLPTAAPQDFADPEGAGSAEGAAPESSAGYGGAAAMEASGEAAALGRGAGPEGDAAAPPAEEDDGSMPELPPTPSKLSANIPAYSPFPVRRPGAGGLLQQNPHAPRAQRAAGDAAGGEAEDAAPAVPALRSRASPFGGAQVAPPPEAAEEVESLPAPVPSAQEERAPPAEAAELPTEEVPAEEAWADAEAAAEDAVAAEAAVEAEEAFLEAGPSGSPGDITPAVAAAPVEPAELAGAEPAEPAELWAPTEAAAPEPAVLPEPAEAAAPAGLEPPSEEAPETAPSEGAAGEPEAELAELSAAPPAEVAVGELSSVAAEEEEAPAAAEAAEEPPAADGGWGDLDFDDIADEPATGGETVAAAAPGGATEEETAAGVASAAEEAPAADWPSETEAAAAASSTAAEEAEVKAAIRIQAARRMSVARSLSQEERLRRAAQVAADEAAAATEPAAQLPEMVSTEAVASTTAVDEDLLADEVLAEAAKEPSWNDNGESTSSWVVLQEQVPNGGVAGADDASPQAVDASGATAAAAEAVHAPEPEASAEALQEAVAPPPPRAAAEELESAAARAAEAEELPEAGAEEAPRGAQPEVKPLALELRRKLAEVTEHRDDLQRRLEVTEAVAAARQAELEVLRLRVEGMERELEQQREKAAEDLALEVTQHSEALRSEVQRREALEVTLAKERRLSEGRQKELSDLLAAGESQRHEVEARAATLDERMSQLEGEKRHIAEAIAASEAGKAISPPRPVPGSPGANEEEFNLPDFVWSCGNSEVMAFVQKIMEENVRLKKFASEDAGALIIPPQKGALAKAQLFANLEAQEVSAERAIAFASSVGEDDGAQIQPLMKLFEMYKGDLSVCSKVCEALENLTFNDNSANRQAITRMGGVEAILDMLEQHKAAAGQLLRPAMDTLWNLTFEDEAVDRATEAGGIERVAEVMNTHANTIDLQSGACAVILNLAVREPNRWRIVKGGIANLIATAMERHPLCEDVLEQGCQALYMLAYNPTIRPMIVAAKGLSAAEIAAGYKNGAGRAQKWGKWLLEILDV